MAIDKYIWPVQIQNGASVDYKNRDSSVQFGGGYEQLTEDGPNSETLEYAIEFSGIITAVDEMNPLKLRDFLRAHVFKAFTFTPPGESMGLYRVAPGSISYRVLGKSTATVTATLQTAIGVYA